MTHVISLLNMKGGVGKTTTTVLLAEFLAGEFGRKVLVIDMDPQISLSITMLGEHAWSLRNDAGRTLATFFSGLLHDHHSEFDIHKVVERNASNVSTVNDVDLLPSSLDVIPLLPHLEAIGAAARSIDPPPWLSFGNVIAPLVEDYDYVLLDCPPNLGVMAMCALYVSEGYIVPTIPDVLSTYGIPALQDQVKRFAATVQIPTPIGLGTILTKHEARSSVHRGQIVRLKNDSSIPPLLYPPVPQATRISAAVEGGFFSLKMKYGYGQIYDGLFDLAEAFRQRVEENE